jgi:hypothetical protein
VKKKDFFKDWEFKIHKDMTNLSWRWVMCINKNKEIAKCKLSCIEGNLWAHRDKVNVCDTDSGMVEIKSNGKSNQKKLKKVTNKKLIQWKKDVKESLFPRLPKQSYNVNDCHPALKTCTITCKFLPKRINHQNYQIGRLIFSYEKQECGDETIVVYPNGEQLNSTKSQKLKKIFDKWIPSNVGKSYTKNGFEFECKMEGNRSQWIFSTVECGVKTIVVNPNGKQIKSKKNLNKIQKLFRSVKESMPSKVGNGFTKDGYKFECQKEGYETQWMVSKAKDENDESRRLQLADDADV